MRVAIGDADIEVDLHGTAGPAIVLVHGLGGSRHSWDALVPWLAERSRVAVPDLRGCGASTRGSAACTLAGAADDIEAVAAAIGFDRYVLVGHSLGGVIAQEILARHPPNVVAAVLISTSSRLNEKASANWQRLADAVEARGLDASPAAAARGFAEGFAEAHPEVVADQARQTAAANPKVYAEQARAASSYDYTTALAGVTCPVLVLQGLGDRLTPPGGSVLLHRALPAGARLEMIEGAGHNLPLELPERVAASILDFCATHAC